jgi:hypothetical protein
VSVENIADTEVRWSPATHALGRNGRILCKGVETSCGREVFVLTALTSRGNPARCQIAIPYGSLPGLIAAMQEAAREAGLVSDVKAAKAALPDASEWEEFLRDHLAHNEPGCPLADAIRFLENASEKHDLYRLEGLRGMDGPDVRVVDVLPIGAEVHSDDRRFEVDFDARRYFMEARAEDIEELAVNGWADEEPADAVALHMEDHVPEIAHLMAYCRATTNPRNPVGSVGFECSVNERQALAWLRVRRPDVYKVLEERGYA